MIKQPFDIHRRVVAHKTSESWDTIPHAGIVIELDVTEICAVFRELRSHPEFADVRLTINSIMLKLIAECMKVSPDMNAHIFYNRKNDTGVMDYLETIDIAIPMISHDRRIITPVLRDVGGQSLRDVCVAMDVLKRRVMNTHIDLLLYEAGLDDTFKRLRRGELLKVLRRFLANFIGTKRVALPSREARARYFNIPATERLTAGDLLEASIMVSNLGSIMPELRCHLVLMEIIAPEITAIALAGVRKQQVVYTDSAGADHIAIRDIMPFTFYIDHRALDFAHVTGFIDKLLVLCAHPEELLHPAS